MIKKYHLDINFEPDYELTLNEWGQWSADFDRHATDPIITNKIENLFICLIEKIRYFCG